MCIQSFFSSASPQFSLIPYFLSLNIWRICVIGFESFPFPSSSCHSTAQSHRQERVKISYNCSEGAKTEWILRCLLASCLWHHYYSGIAMFHAYDPPAGTNLGETPQQHTQKKTCLTANCLQGALRSLAIYVLGSDTVSLFNCLFSYQLCTTNSQHFNKVAHKNALAFQQLHYRDISFVLYELRNKGWWWW